MAAAARRKNPAKVDVSEIKFTAAEIVMRPVDDLKPFPNNPKKHPPEQIDAMAENMVEFGFDQPILIDELDTILKGHGRQIAARQAGFELVPTIVRAGLSPAQKWAIVISDNQLPTLGGWDQNLLRIGLTTLAKADYPLQLTGFDDIRLATFGVGARAGLVNPDEDVPDPPPDPVSRLGDIWTLGKHRVICGDCTSGPVVAAVLGAAKPQLMVTDPPYGVDYDPNWRDRVYRSDGTKVGAGARGKVDNDHKADWREAWKLFPGDVAYVWHGAMHTAEVEDSLVSIGLLIRCQVIWNKGRIVIGRGDYHWQHEPCWYAVRKGRPGRWAGDRKQSSVWDIAKPQKSELGHSTQKPVECMKRPIENSSRPGDFIYEPFAGTGTTIIAAEMTGRICLAIELNPSYVDLVVRRWERFTGGKATLQGTKRTFDNIEKERAAKAA